MTATHYVSEISAGDKPGPHNDWPWQERVTLSVDLDAARPDEPVAWVGEVTVLAPAGTFCVGEEHAVLVVPVPPASTSDGCAEASTPEVAESPFGAVHAGERWCHLSTGDEAEVLVSFGGLVRWRYVADRPAPGDPDGDTRFQRSWPVDVFLRQFMVAPTHRWGRA